MGIFCLVTASQEGGAWGGRSRWRPLKVLALPLGDGGAFGG